MTFEPHQPQSYRARIDTVGRVTIPAELRTRQGLHSGDEIVLVPHSGSLELKSYAQVLREAQDLFCKAAPSTRMLSDELIAERACDVALDD